MKTLLLTGITGFVGTALTRHLYQQGHTLIVVVRSFNDSLTNSIQQIQIDDLLPNTDWGTAFNDVDTIIHLAARVHVMRDTAANPLNEFRRTNTAATLNLAQQAAAAGVHRFIYLSSIKVNGEHTTNKPFTPKSTTIPTDPYGLSKYEAEQGLMEIAQRTAMEVVIIRPPLVYGEGVKGNFAQLMNWLHKGIPLPLGAIHNQRSLVALPNLIDLITTCIDHPAAANQAFLVSDGKDLSTTGLLKHLAQALDKPARLLPVPQTCLETGLNLLGKQAIAQRLCGNLQIDIRHTCETLNWEPPVSVDDALQQTTQAWLKQQDK